MVVLSVISIATPFILPRLKVLKASGDED